MCPKEKLFQITSSIARTGSIEQKSAVWEWVTKAVPSDLVPKDFMDAWNACDVLVWIEHRDTFRHFFT